MLIHYSWSQPRRWSLLCFAVCPTGGRNSYLNQLHVRFSSVCFGLFFNFKTRISSILSWPKYLASQWPISDCDDHLHITHRSPNCDVQQGAQQHRNHLVMPCPCAWPLRIWSLFISTDFGAEITVSNGYINSRSNVQSGHRTLTHLPCWHNQLGFEDFS